MLQAQIYLDSPNVGELEKKYLERCIDSGFVSTHGPFVSEFENKSAELLGCATTVSVQSGTAGLHIALYELGIGKGDEVIVPVLTFAATANAIKYVGAKPIFADVDPATWNISPAAIRGCITSKTKAIMAVHLYGNPCKMDEIFEIAKQYDLYLIEDAAESLYSKFNEKQTGTFGDFGIFSFNGNKLITTGCGGLIIGKNNTRLDHVRFLVNQARDEDKGYFHPEIGFNYRMSNLQASLGLAQLERIDEFINKKKLFRKIYVDAFNGIKEINLQKAYGMGKSIWWLNSVTIDTQKIGKSIPEIQSTLAQDGIPSRRVFMPLVEFPPYRKEINNQYQHAYSIYEKGLCLPGSTLNNKINIELTADSLLRSIK